MTPEGIREALNRLRKAGSVLRRRPAGDILNCLGEVLESWRDPSSPWHSALLRELPEATGFTRPVVEEGLRHGLAPLSRDALLRLVETELGGPEMLDGGGPTLVSGFDTTTVLLAGSLPTPSLVSMLAPLSLRSPVLVKTASRDPVTASIFHRSLKETDAELAACVEVVGFSGSDPERTGSLLEADCIMATGSNETVKAIAARVEPPRRLVTFGHRFSLAVLGPQATSGEPLVEAARGLALDVSLWDQLGCLSPLALYVVDSGRAVDRVADALAAKLEEAQQRWPRGRLEMEDAERVARERSEAEVRAAAGGASRVLTGGPASWTVVREEDARFRPAPLHRFVRLHPVGDAATLLRVLGPLGSHLAGVAMAGFGTGTARLARELGRIGASRVCSPGSLQSPPLAWHHDNQGVLLPLARFSDIETSSQAPM